MKIKLFFVVLIILCFGLVFKGSALAQYNQYPMRTNPDVPQNFHTYTQNVVLELLAAASCSLAGVDPLSQNGKCLGIDPKTKKIGYVENQGGVIGVMGNLIARTYDIPISSTHFAKDLADNFGIAKKTYAVPIDSDPTSGSSAPSQIGTGYGFRGLLPLIKLWRTFRDIVYLFFVLVFVFIGLGIMFRIKIDPRTVMTIQNQIPKIIIALILVTFSYAIAGFLIDMMYVLTYLMFNLFAPHINDPSNYNPSAIQGKNPLSAVGLVGGWHIAWDASSGIGNILGSLFDGKYGKIIGSVVGMIIGGGAGMAIPGAGVVAGGLMSLAGGALGAAFGGKIVEIVGGLVAFVVIAAALLAALFRLWFALIKAYIFIMINTVIAPFWIAGGLIPGSTKNFGMWMRDMIGNLLAFPTTLFMFLIGKVFIDAFGEGKDINNQFAPPLIGNPGDQNNFGAIIGLGIILLTPQVVTMVRAAIKAPEGKYSSAIGGMIGAGAGMNKAALAPVGRGLFGRKDPYTGKRLGGVVRYTGKRLGGKFLDKLPGGGVRNAEGEVTGWQAKISKPFKALRRMNRDQITSDRGETPPRTPPAPAVRGATAASGTAAAGTGAAGSGATAGGVARPVPSQPLERDAGMEMLVGHDDEEAPGGAGSPPPGGENPPT